jgi:rubrerythrin
MSGENERAKKMLSTALEMEEKGKTFYENSISDCQGELTKQLFTMLRDDEIVHTERIKKIYDGLTGSSDWQTSWAAQDLSHNDLGAIFRGLAEKHGKNVTCSSTDADALDIGIDFEAKSISFYQEQLGKATDELEKKFLQKMVMEEKSHHAALTDMKFYLTDPEGWFADKEHHGLDGA